MRAQRRSMRPKAPARALTQRNFSRGRRDSIDGHRNASHRLHIARTQRRDHGSSAQREVRLARAQRMRSATPRDTGVQRGQRGHSDRRSARAVSVDDPRDGCLEASRRTNTVSRREAVSGRSLTHETRGAPVELRRAVRRTGALPQEVCVRCERVPSRVRCRRAPCPQRLASRSECDPGKSVAQVPAQFVRVENTRAPEVRECRAHPASRRG